MWAYQFQVLLEDCETSVMLFLCKVVSVMLCHKRLEGF
jgi:hypothetical protein